ncbi:hypothetical protein F4V91_08515 [Neorhizobium galegae]|uniref:GIY-YIG domain-containing protein n=1 Tax=Neorhizobium galegae TaxID=399 RepID=A0A6A1TU91_NEOGA|nr:hypothetical protein [Neorhizobium galegae]KAB1086467.1 hypothetical protein F4V91_08515 [Neorhizobium galegae]
MSTGIFGLLLAPPQQATAKHHEWQGRSGRFWITTVYPLFADFEPISSVYVMVKRNPNGTCSPIYIGQTDNLRRRMIEHTQEKLIAAYRLGANELHAHFLAQTDSERFAVETDLRNGHSTPINDQPSAAGGLFGLGALYQATERRSSLGDLLSGH